jgi:hypothetical protein
MGAGEDSLAGHPRRLRHAWNAASWDGDPNTTSQDMAATRAVDVVSVIFRITSRMHMFMDHTSGPQPTNSEQTQEVNNQFRFHDLMPFFYFHFQ